MPAWSIKGSAPIAHSNFANRLHCFFVMIAVVKLVTLILSLFLLGLSIAPCSDVPKSDNMEISLSSQGDHDHREAEDLCSPLCVCHCCHSHLVVNQVFINELGALTFPLHRTTYTDPITSGYISSILQPPQV